jgi:sarcosine oxidase
VIVGGGAMGSAAARTLGERGLDVVVVEQFELGHRRGSSAGPTRIFRLAYPEPDYVELAQRALEAWRRLERAAGERLLLRTGGLDAGPEAEACAAALEACGVSHKWMPASRFEWLAGVERVLHHPDAGVCLSERTIAAQARLARAAGVELLEGTPVRAVHVAGDSVIVEAADGEIAAPVAVVTAGAWTAKLLGLPVTSKLTHVAYFRPRGRGPTTTFVQTDADRPPWYAYAVPHAGGPVKIGQQLGAEPVDPDAGPFVPDPAWIRAHADYVRRRLPGLDPEPVAAETCLYPMSPDEDFIVDRIGPLVIGAGFGGHGFKFTPLIGELLADLALGAEPVMPRQRFSATRVAA